MSNFKLANLKKPLLGMALLKTAPALMAEIKEIFVFSPTPTSGKTSQLGDRHLRLDELPMQNVTMCLPTGIDTLTDSQLKPDEFTALISPSSASAQITFIVSDMLAQDEPHILLLAHSQQLSSEPQIKTPNSINKFQLDLSTVEIIGVYNIPALPLMPQMATSIGMANSAPYSKLMFEVNLDTSELPNMIEKGQDTIYLQAALLSWNHYSAGDFKRMILSEVDTIHFGLGNKCPEETDTYTLSDVQREGLGGVAVVDER